MWSVFELLGDGVGENPGEYPAEKDEDAAQESEARVVEAEEPAGETPAGGETAKPNVVVGDPGAGRGLGVGGPGTVLAKLDDGQNVFKRVDERVERWATAGKGLLGLELGPGIFVGGDHRAHSVGTPEDQGTQGSEGADGDRDPEKLLLEKVNREGSDGPHRAIRVREDAVVFIDDLLGTVVVSSVFEDLGELHPRLSICEFALGLALKPFDAVARCQQLFLGREVEILIDEVLQMKVPIGWPASPIVRERGNLRSSKFKNLRVISSKAGAARIQDVWFTNLRPHQIAG